MDVDSEVDQAFLAKFDALGTTDRDVLITELQRLLNFQLSHTGCVFFLDMTNWNLQAAVGAFYDFNSSQTVDKLPCMEFLEDITIGEGEAIPPCTKFTKTWRLKNNGTEKWPAGVFLKFVSGVQLGPITLLLVDSVEPLEFTDVSVEMISPAKDGIYQAQWRMCTPMGQYFGDLIWVIIAVNDNGLLGVTQQLSKLGRDSRFSPIMQTDHSASVNPFGHVEIPRVPFNSPVKPTEYELRTIRRISNGSKQDDPIHPDDENDQ